MQLFDHFVPICMSKIGKIWLFLLTFRQMFVGLEKMHPKKLIFVSKK